MAAPPASTSYASSASSASSSSSPGPRPTAHRVREAREILAAVAGVDGDGDVDAYAPALFDAYLQQQQQLQQAGAVLARGELEATVLRLLLANNAVFAMFLKLLSPRDKALDPLRKLQQRAERVLHDLAAYSAAYASRPPPPPPPPPPRSRARPTSPGPPHLWRAVEQIAILAARGGREPEPWERASAARALVWILRAVVMDHSADAHPGHAQDDRNLYQRLIGNARAGPAFAVDALLLLPDQNLYIDELEHIRERVEVCGYQESFMRKLDGREFTATLCPLAPSPSFFFLRPSISLAHYATVGLANCRRPLPCFSSHHNAPPPRVHPWQQLQCRTAARWRRLQEAGAQWCG